jgi:methylthioribose-1-phosphate isomerase
MLCSLMPRELFLCLRRTADDRRQTIDDGLDVNSETALPQQSSQVDIGRDSEVPAPVGWLSGGTLRLVDQTLLPSQLEYINCRSIEELAGAIRTLKVRGAPAIGVAAAYGLCLAANSSHAPDLPTFLSDIESAASLVRSTRPTAVNLGWALDTVLAAARNASDVQGARDAIVTTAQRIERENEEANKRMGEHGAQLLSDGMNVLTHCNAGPLAAGGIGSALGVIYTAHSQGKGIHVWVDETRPLLQGARLTAWELSRWDIPCTLIADSMAASLMRAGRVDAVLVGADRIAANGDVANKIGTYGLATLAHAHDLPFYVAAPISTIDLNIHMGDDIKIEERHSDEVTYHGGKRLAPDGVAVYNPAFDVTPNRLVSCIITESGILRQPYSASLREL